MIIVFLPLFDELKQRGPSGPSGGAADSGLQYRSSLRYIAVSLPTAGPGPGGRGSGGHGLSEWRCLVSSGSGPGWSLVSSGSGLWALVVLVQSGLWDLVVLVQSGLWSSGSGPCS